MMDHLTCKRCHRPYVRPFTFTCTFSFRPETIGWEGCADCAYQLQRQLVDLMLKAAQPTKKVQSKLKHLERMEEWQ